MDEVDEPLVADVGIEALDKLGTLRHNAPVALAAVAGAAEVTPERQKRRRTDIAGVCAQCDRLDEVGRGADGARDHEGDVVADALLTQAGVDRGERKFDGDAHVVADAGGRSARATAEAVQRDDIRAAARNAAGDRRDVVHGGNLDDDGLFVRRRLFQGEDELAQVLDGVNIVVRCGRDGIHALGDHTGDGDLVRDLFPGKVPADAGLCALPHLDLDRGVVLQILREHAESARCDLHDRILAVLIEIAVQAAFSRVVVDAQLLRGAREALVRVIGNGAVAHCGEHDGRAELELRRKSVPEPAVRVALDLRALLAQVHRRLHGFAQGVDRGVCDLRGIDEQLVPVNGVGLGIAHGREQNAARARLTVDLVDGGIFPVGVDLVGVVRLSDFQGVRRTDADTAVTVDALGAVGEHLAEALVVIVDLVGALSLTDAAGDAARLVAHDLVFGIDEKRLHYLPPFRSYNSKMTGSPPAGARIASSSGWMTRIAASSLAMYALSPRSATTMERSLSLSLSAISPPV